MCFEFVDRVLKKTSFKEGFLPNKLIRNFNCSIIIIEFVYFK